MFAGDEENVAKAFLGQVPAFRCNLIETQGDSQDRVIPGEAAITAIIDALVRKIERREQPHRATEVFQGQRMRFLRQRFQFRVRFGRNQRLEAAENRRLPQSQTIDYLRERHCE